MFGRKIFGVESTTTVLQEMSNFFFKEQHPVFASWKVLRTIDLSYVGGLNYDTLETLWNVEKLNRLSKRSTPFPEGSI